MPPTPSRAAAFDVLLRVQQRDSYASELLYSPRYKDLTPQDHALATEIVMGVLRWRSVLDDLIAQRSSQGLKKLDPEVLTALRIGAYQLQFLSGVPARAAVNESVELAKQSRKRSAAAFVNAVLRKLAGAAKTGREAAAKTAGELASAYAHPLWLVERWANHFGLEAARKICEYDQAVPEIALRLAAASVEDELRREGIQLAPGKLLASARRVTAGQLASTRAFREGRVFIQDEASQLVALLVGSGRRMLDCCAAPGGKARVMAEKNPDARILAVELHPHRARLLRRLVTAANVKMVTGDVRELRFNTKFDRVLADVPCSGTGTLAHNPEIKWRLKPGDLEDLQKRQLEILLAAMKTVAPGGSLVYSTCSLEPEENAGVLERALAADGSFTVVPCREALEELRSQGEISWSDPDALVAGLYLRTIPGVHPCEGFFAAVLRKN
jgi:16S rRNA (cytosine967-C5)-methyltransferase